MTRKTSVYFAQPLMSLIKNLDDGDSVSGRINRCAERYQAILARHGIDLDEQEKRIVGNTLAGSRVDALQIRYLADSIQDSELADSPVARRLIQKLGKSCFADRVALVERLGF